MTAQDPALEPTALIVTRALGPAVEVLEDRHFANVRERIAYLGLLRKVALDAEAASVIAEALSPDATIAPHSPVVVLARSVAEAAGQFARWFLNGDLTDEQRDFEIRAAFLSGELSRLKHDTRTAGYEERIREVRATVDNLTASLERHAYWNTLNKKDRNNVKIGMWKPVSKSALPQALGYGPQREAGLYGWMSDGAHGGTRLLQQLTQEAPDVQRYMRSSLNFVAAPVALLLHRLALQEPVVQAYLTAHPDVQFAVDLQARIALE